MHSPNEEHLQIVYRILMCVEKNPKKGLFLKKTVHRGVEVYMNANRSGSATDIFFISYQTDVTNRKHQFNSQLAQNPN